MKISSAAAPILFGRLDPGRPAERGVDLVFPKRGRRSIESLLLYSGYPIGLFRKGRCSRCEDERLVYPAPANVPFVPPDPREAEGGDPRDGGRGRGAEIRNLREASFGDDPRDVHWPQTARQGRFIVKERASEEGRDALVALDTHRPSSAGRSWDDAFERAVSRGGRARAAAPHAREPRGAPPRRTSSCRRASGPAHRRGLLRALALVEPGPESGRPPARLPRFRRDLPDGSRAGARRMSGAARVSAGQTRPPLFRSSRSASSRSAASRFSRPSLSFFTNALELGILVLYLGALAVFLRACAAGACCVSGIAR